MSCLNNSETNIISILSSEDALNPKLSGIELSKAESWQLWLEKAIFMFAVSCGNWEKASPMEILSSLSDEDKEALKKLLVSTKKMRAEFEFYHFLEYDC